MAVFVWLLHNTAKERNQTKRHPLPLVSCAVLKSWALRNSPNKNLGLKQSSLKISQLFKTSQARQQGTQSQNHTTTVIQSVAKDPEGFEVFNLKAGFFAAP